MKFLKYILTLFSIVGLFTYCNYDLEKFEKEIESMNLNINKQNSSKLLKGHVKKVYDGDTITLEDGNKIRLYGIDAPELKQKGGKFSKDTLSNLILNTTIEYQIMNTDKYGRNVSKIYYKGTYVNLYMLEQGAAWWYEDYAKNDKDLEYAFLNSQKNKIGIFKEKNIENPSEYRKRNKQ